MSYLEKIQQMYGMIGQGKMYDALDQYYADNVQVIEATGDVRNGKAEQHAALKQWESSIKEHHGGGVGAISANEEAGTTSVESWADITTQDGNRFKMEEVAVQHWEGDKIVKERFYYNIPG